MNTGALRLAFLIVRRDRVPTIGVEVDIPEALADAALEFLYPMREQLKESKVFGVPVAPPPDSGAVLRLLGLLGRTAW